MLHNQARKQSLSWFLVICLLFFCLFFPRSTFHFLLFLFLSNRPTFFFFLIFIFAYVFIFIFALPFHLLLSTYYCTLRFSFPLSTFHFLLYLPHPSCGYSFRFVFRQNLKSANSLRSNKRIYNGLALSQTVKNNASGDAAQFKAAS